jgi:tetratricopeptide (TPR) repeat protein
MTDLESRGAGSAPIVWGAIPTRSKNFTGRDAILERLRSAQSSKVKAVVPEAEAQQANPLPRAVQGLGGVGKTAIAIEYAHRYAADYDVVWWVPADQLPLVRASLAALAGRLGLEAAVDAGIDGAATAAVDALRRGEPYSRWLLVFDNADQPEDFPNYIPYGSGDVLITSRNHRWQATIDTVPLDVFSRNESIEFLNKRVRPAKLAEADASLLAEKLGDLPLALDQAGAMLSETGMPVEEYAQLLDEQFDKIMAEGKSAEYGTSVTAAWTLSVSRVEEQQPEALRLLRCCAFFGPDPIPRDVFRRSSQAAETRVSDLLADAIPLSRSIRELGRFALVTISGREIVVHRLIQALLRAELSEQEQADYRHDVHLILAAAAPISPNDDRQWERYQELLPHVTSEATELARCRDPKVRAFALDMLRYLYLSSSLTSCDELAQAFIDQWLKDSGPDAADVLEAQRIRGNVLRQLGQYEQAYEITERALARCRAALGDRHPVTVATQMSFGADQRARGNFAAALDMDRETFESHEAAFGMADPQSMRALHNLALDYGLNSEYEKAVDRFKRAYQLESEAREGISAAEVLIAWYCLAWAVRLQGRYHDARDLGEEAWDYGKERLGSDHFATLRTANGLSVALRRIAPFREDAMRIGEEVLDISRRKFGNRNPDTMAAAVNVTNIRRTNGLVDEAYELAHWTATEYPHVYGPDHPYSYGCIGNLGLMFRVTGDAEQARMRNEEALAGLDARLGRDHDISLVIALNLASDLAELGEIGAARALGEDTLRRVRKVLGVTHPLTLAAAANLSLDLRADGANEAAAELSAETMRGYAETLSLNHPDALVAAEGRRLDFDFDPQPL